MSESPVASRPAKHMTVAPQPSPAKKPAEPAREAAATPAPASYETAVRIANFHAWYGDFHVLHGIDIAIPEKNVTAFIGPSGCGKSTMLRWINRMNDIVPEAHADGTLELHGMDVLPKKVDVVDLRRRVGMVFQKPNPFPKSIFDNVAFGPRLHLKVSRSELSD